MSIYLVLFGVEALIVLIGFFIGMKRGAEKSIVRFVELVIAAILSLFISKWLAEVVMEKAPGVIDTFLNDSLKDFVHSASIAEELLIGLEIAIVLPVIFALVFMVIKLLSLIGLSAITKLFTHGKDEKKKRIIGAAVGTLSGLLTAAILLCPFYSITKIIAGIPKETVSQLTELSEMQAISEYLPTKDMTPPVSALFVKATSSFEVEGEVYCSTEEMPRIFALVADIAVAFTESKNNGEKDIVNFSAAIAASVAHIEDSKYIATVTTSLINSIGENIKNGNDVLGLTKNMDSAKAEMVMKAIGNILTSVNPENIAANIAALAGDGENEGVLSVLTEITSSGNGKDMLKDKEKVDKLADSLIEIAQNPELSSTMDSISELGAGILGETLPEKGTEKREEYVNALSESVNDILSATKDTQSDFSASVDTATEIVLEKVSQLTDAEITESEAKLIAICALHNFGTTENYADAEGSPVSIEDIESFFGLNK
jgi:hypothetical protein